MSILPAEVRKTSSGIVGEPSAARRTDDLRTTFVEQSVSTNGGSLHFGSTEWLDIDAVPA